MQNLIKLIAGVKSKKNTTQLTVLNTVREYVQVLILKAIYNSKYGRGLSFMGGTCLRLCYDLKRYSEDLDFTMDRAIKNYSFKELNELIVRHLKERGFLVSVNISDNKTVQKSFIKITGILQEFELSQLTDQKLHIKLEVDRKPIKVSEKNIETHFITRFNEIFPILKHDKSTLFAGKILAIFTRPYAKGRDYYDLIWYLSRHIEPNLSYLNRGLKTAKNELKFKNTIDLLKVLEKKVKTAKPKTLLKDVGRFLEDPNEDVWILNYQDLFDQLAKSF